MVGGKKAYVVRPVLKVPEVEESLRAGAPVAIGLSGGKDSGAVAAAMVAYLDEIGHCGARLGIHSDLGLIEWRDSIESVRRICERTSLEMIVVRPSGSFGEDGLVARWEGRWAANAARYRNLECVRVIMPWSSSSLRFCTSEAKIAPIRSYLIKRFRGQTVISVTGIRREESPRRARSPIAKEYSAGKTLQTRIMDYHPILDYRLEDVWLTLHLNKIKRHAGYDLGMTRISCAACILSSKHDLSIAMRVPEHLAIYRRLVALEASSTFSFQKGWLGDVAPELLDAETRARLKTAKENAARRIELESLIPKHLLYVKGWPHAVPTPDEALMLGRIRMEVSTLIGVEARYTRGDEVTARYEELMRLKESRAIKARSSTSRAASPPPLLPLLLPQAMNPRRLSSTSSSE